MSNTLTKIALFVGGAVLGSAVTYKVVKDKYEMLLEEEIQSVREAYDRLAENQKKIHECIEKHETNKPAKPLTVNTHDKDAYTEIASEYSMPDYEKADNVAEDQVEEDDDMEDEDEMVKPYIISPEEFGDMDYEENWLTLYADGMVVDDNTGDIIDGDDLIEILGEGTLEQMGKYEADLLHVRNENIEADFEICKSLLKFYGEDDE